MLLLQPLKPVLLFPPVDAHRLHRTTQMHEAWLSAERLGHLPRTANVGQGAREISETTQLNAAIVNGISPSTCALVLSSTCLMPTSCLASQMPVDARALTEPLPRP